MSAEADRTASRFGRIATLLPILIFAALGAVFLWSLLNRTDDLPSPLIGNKVPQFDLLPIEGRQVGLSSADLQGQVSIVNVWASWCVPCRVEMPLLVDLAKDGGVPVYGINFKDDAEAALSFLAELGDPYTALGADRSGRVAIDWGVYGLPETFIIDASGQIAYKHIGPFDPQSLEEEILPVVRRLQAERPS
nr:DsbE family thiol:disulfide interchange protein [arsenite-oxidising bacterium NT-25]